jgi:hypothetical protein
MMMNEMETIEIQNNMTDEELNKVQEHLSPMDFQRFLEELVALHCLNIEEILNDTPTVDPRGYSLE